MKLSKPATIISLTFITLIALAILGYGFWLTNKQSQSLNWSIQLSHRGEVPAPKDIQVLTTTTDTSNWLTYRNEKYGWEIKYPRKWRVTFESRLDSLTENSDDWVILQDYEGKELIGGIIISKLHDNPENLSIDKRDYKVEGAPVEYKIKFDNIVGATISNVRPEIYNDFVIINFTKNNNSFSIEWGAHDYEVHLNFPEGVKEKYKKAYKEFLNIISTFHFYK